MKTIFNVVFTHHREGRCRCYWRGNRTCIDQNVKTIWNVVFTHHREGRNVSCRCHFHSLGQSNLIFADLNVKTIWNIAFTHHREGRNVSCRCHWRSNRSSADNHSRWWLRSSRKNCWLLKKYRKQIYIAKLFFYSLS